MDDQKISRRTPGRQSKPSPTHLSPLKRARADSLGQYIRWRCHVHGETDLQVRLSSDLRESARILLGFTSKQLDHAVEALVRQRRAWLVPSAGGVYLRLRKGGLA